MRALASVVRMSRAADLARLFVDRRSAGGSARGSDERPRWRTAAASAVEVVVSVGLATAAVAVLQLTAPAAGLGIVYLLAVLGVAIRRGEIPALLAAVLAVVTLNFLFITPRHRLAIAHSQDVVELGVLLIAALVVGRLAALARHRATESEQRAQMASAREREATLLADVATAILARAGLEAQLESVGSQIAAATGAAHARIGLGPDEAEAEGGTVVQLPSRFGNARLHLWGDSADGRALVARLAGPLGGLIDVAVEGERVADREAEAEAARRTDVARTAILHAISHDLRSPITAIRTAAAALRTAQVTDAERNDLIRAVEAESSRLGRMVDDLLDLSRIEAGAVAPRSDWCDLRDGVISAAQRLGPEHEIVFALPANLPLVRADAAQLERVFANLVENAVKFSPPGSPVEITGGASRAWVTVRVTDHGPGIPREHRAHVFEPFYRGRRTQNSGSGLGLAICRGFVEANGGRIVVQSGAGRGTSFAVSFPAVAPPMPPADAGPPAEDDGDAHPAVQSGGGPP